MCGKGQHGGAPTIYFSGRDINELNLAKVRGLNVKYKYALPSIKRNDISPKIIDLFKHTLVSIDVVNNLIVLKTLICAILLSILWRQTITL